VTANAEPRERRDTPGVVAPPPLIYLACLGLGFVLEWLLPEIDPPAALQVLGIVLLVVGLALFASFVSALTRARTPLDPYSQTTAIVTTGPYRLSRNPAYLAMALIYAGIALVAEAPWALAMLVPAVLIVQYGVIAREERYLERLFGEEYLRFKRRTRRWL
jgi:protein-S-isoprenylcysteine O-methyltransferase Ste14